MTKNEWLSYFDANKSNIKLVVEAFNSATWILLIEFRLKEDTDKMLEIMNNIWYFLPDHIYNVMNNPPGWKEFLYLLENEIE